MGTPGEESADRTGQSIEALESPSEAIPPVGKIAVEPSLHRRLKAAAALADISLQDFVDPALRALVGEPPIAKEEGAK
jgi:predicted HicB family RNase H-like nuclease